jgi:2-amino-4-hydroxy-6-hydroxymethyldihydropteridine diphosphokinase
MPTVTAMTRPRHTVFLGLGSNVGDKKGNLRHALQQLGVASVQVIRVSPVYRTEPVDYTEQDWFLNQVVEVETELTPRALLDLCQKIESMLGRKRNILRGPRSIDLDILFFDECVLSQPDLTIPHPRLHERRFVLVPLSDIAPAMIHPLFRQSVRDLLKRCNDRAPVTPLIESPD